MKGYIMILCAGQSALFQKVAKLFLDIFFSMNPRAAIAKKKKRYAEGSEL
jgi:hypothetical protein